MPIQLFHRTDVQDGDLRVKGYGAFADIILDDNGSRLTVESTQDCDRLIRAAVEAKKFLCGDQAPDLAAAAASPDNPYGPAAVAKHGHFDAGSPAEVAEGVDLVIGQRVEDRHGERADGGVVVSSLGDGVFEVVWDGTTRPVPAPLCSLRPLSPLAPPAPYGHQSLTTTQAEGNGK